MAVKPESRIWGVICGQCVLELGGTLVQYPVAIAIPFCLRSAFEALTFRFQQLKLEPGLVLHDPKPKP